jgi:hypothetical protein
MGYKQTAWQSRIYVSPIEGKQTRNKRKGKEVKKEKIRNTEKERKRSK